MITIRSQRASASSSWCVVSSSETPRRAQRRQHLVDPLAALRIDADGRLVEQHHARPVQHAARDVEPPLHAARESLHRLVGAIGRGRSTRAPTSTRSASVRRRDAVERAEDLEVLARREQRIDARAPAARRRAPARVLPAAHRPPEQPDRRRASSRTRPAMARISVVLPAPLGPSRPSSSPASSASEAPSSAGVLPKDLRASRTVSRLSRISRGVYAYRSRRFQGGPQESANGAYSTVSVVSVPGSSPRSRAGPSPRASSRRASGLRRAGAPR